MNKNPNNIDLHVFENHHTYDLMLPKPACKGLTTVKPKGVFIADKSFQEYVKVGMIKPILVNNINSAIFRILPFWLLKTEADLPIV